MARPTTIAERIALTANFPTPRLQLVSEHTGRRRLAHLRRSGSLGEAQRVLAQQCDQLRHREIGEGSQRRAFSLGRRHVFKIPMLGWIPRFNLDANVNANITEVWAYETQAEGVPVAPCKLVWHESGIPIVIMERVHTVSHMTPMDRPPWAKLVDRSQIGHSKILRGLVAYDAGIASLGYFDDEMHRTDWNTASESVDAKWQRRLQRDRLQQLRAVT